MRGTVVVCDFTSGLDELPRKHQKDPLHVLRALKERQRFSVFEATANQEIASTIERVHRLGWVRYVGGAFPWTDVEVTEAGEAALQAAERKR